MSIVGTWRNEYGSVMTLAREPGVGTGALRGTYESSTGSVGRYAVAGFTAGAAATATGGQPVALAISWHALDDGAPDPSWRWASGLSGQLSLIDGEEILELSHLLVASDDFPGLMPAGCYIDKLHYRRWTPARPAAVALPEWPAAPTEAWGGRWLGTDGSVLTLHVDAAPAAGFGIVRGTVAGDGPDVPITGFADLTGDGDTGQSLSLTAACPGTPAALSLSGTLTPRGGVLRLCCLRSRATAPGDRYAQTSATWTEYRRA